MAIPDIDKKRIAKLIRLLSSNLDGEVLAAARMLGKLCSFNDLGDLIDNPTPTLSKTDMQHLYDSGFQDGYLKAVNEGRQHSIYNTGINPGINAFADASEPLGESARKTIFCLDRIQRLDKIQEKRFIEDMGMRTRPGGRPLSSAQTAWLNRIYQKLGGR